MSEVLTEARTSAEIRRMLGYPVLDADGHLVEYLPPLEDFVKQVGGSRFGMRILAEHQPRDPAMDDWKQTRAPGVWWSLPTRNTLDRATSALPKLLYERMDEIGLDYTVLFPSSHTRVQVYRLGGSEKAERSRDFDVEVEQVKYRAFNSFRAALCQDYADRMTPAAFLPMITPQIAIEELEYSVGQLGLKTISIRAQPRPVPAIHASNPELFPNVFWLDTFGIDSAYDYDPFWAKCVELKVPVMCHGGGFGFTSRNSPTNAVYNHIGHTADANEMLCKSLLLGGVLRRFPALRVAFLECGVAWGARVYCDLIDRWHKRNRVAIHNYDPALLDRDLFLELHDRYGDDRIRATLDQVLEVSTGVNADKQLDPSVIDDFAASGVEGPEDIRDQFVPAYFFGCEADDPTNRTAFDETMLPFGVHLQSVLSSDIGHWDVPDMSKVLVEAYEQVENGRLTEDNLRELLFGNAVKLFCGANPAFFEGTAIEAAVATELARTARAG